MGKKKNTEIELFPWEQQPGESAKKYEAFQHYLMMKSDGVERSLRKVASDLNKSLTHIGTLSSEFKWVERVEAWDSEQARLATLEHQKKIKKKREQEYKSGSVLAKKALSLLSSVDNAKLSEIVTALKTGYDMMGRGLGDVGDVIEVRDGGQAPDLVQIYIPDNKRNDEDTFDDLEV